MAASPEIGKKYIYIYFAIVAKLVIMPCINTISDNALLHFSCFLWGFFSHFFTTHPLNIIIILFGIEW